MGLVWERALVLYNYVKPLKLPEHDDVKTLSITADTDSLLRRIVALIPDTVAIERRKTIALDFLTGRTSRMKKLKKLRTLPSDTRDLFYLLADYAFKSNSDMETAINYYAIDLTFNRFALLCCVSIFFVNNLEVQIFFCPLRYFCLSFEIFFLPMKYFPGSGLTAGQRWPWPRALSWTAS